MARRDQDSLFGELPGVRPAAHDEALRELGRSLPDGLFLGTSSWSFPGWQGIVYDRHHEGAVLAREGLHAYAQHPLFRSVGIDRTYYAPIDAAAFERYADDVPDGFRFLVKAPGELLRPVHPFDARPPLVPGQPNPHFLDAERATQIVVDPMRRGLGAKAGPLVFQFSPMDVTSLGGPEGFAERLGAFLEGLPSGPLYAVEVRNRQLITRSYGEVLRRTGAVHCVTVYPGMPTVSTQGRVVMATGSRALVIRWMLRPNLRYSEARSRFAPFDRLAAPDDDARQQIAELIRVARGLGMPAWLIANNKAEGSSPLSLRRLAQALRD